MKWFTLSSIAAVSLLLPLSTYAAQVNLGSSRLPGASTAAISETLAQQPPGDRPSEERGGERGERLQQLNLTPEQTEQIRAIKEQARSANEGLREQMQSAREQMQSLMAGNASADRLRQQHNTIQTLHQQMSDRRFDTMLQVREILTPEQRAQLAEMGPPKRGGRGLRSDR
ncbi:MAG: Spy/CpxP family protein refolding chaperone [Cyanobacteriota bacterium]|nr:Spy/CpxP family protein refolding chaperone [Cyanobacteriota bacterium]